MKVEVTKSFARILKKKPHLKSLFEDGVERALNDPSRISPAAKTGSSRTKSKGKGNGVYKMDLRSGNRAILVKDSSTGSLIPHFVGSHEDYNRVIENKAVSAKTVLEDGTVMRPLKVEVNINHISCVLGQNLAGDDAKKFIKACFSSKEEVLEPV